eukprot:scaffold29624_cov30-Tisochrysis_lutea.AAC.3
MSCFGALGLIIADRDCNPPWKGRGRANARGELPQGRMRGGRWERAWGHDHESTRIELKTSGVLAEMDHN